MWKFCKWVHQDEEEPSFTRNFNNKKETAEDPSFWSKMFQDYLKIIEKSSLF